MTDQTLSWVLLGLVLKTSRRISPVSKAVDLIHAFILEDGLIQQCPDSTALFFSLCTLDTCSAVNYMSIFRIRVVNMQRGYSVAWWSLV